jgi:hypothetical protein
MMAEPTLYHLSLYVKRIGRQISDQSAKYVKAAARAVLIDLAKNNPVDTSLSVSNWTVGIGYSPVNLIPPHFPGVKGSTEAASRAQTIAYGRKIINMYKSRQVLHISNNVDYITYLESSHKPKAGFVARAVIKGNLATKKVKLILK